MYISIQRAVSLDRPLTPERLPGEMFTQEAAAHRFDITCTKDGEPIALSGTCTARFIRADGTTIFLGQGAEDGREDYASISADGHALVTLHSDCYHIAGRFQLTVYVSAGEETTAVYSCVGVVGRASTDTVIDSGEAIPGAEAWAAAYQEAVQATADANAAATSATNAAQSGVRTDTAEQGLSATQQSNARTNIAAASEEEVVGLKSDLSENSDFQKVFGDINLIPVILEDIHDVRGITMVWDGYVATISGTSTASYSYMILKIRNLSDSVVFNAGETYKIRYSSDNVPVMLYWVDSAGKSAMIGSYIYSDTEFTIPEDAVGFSVRLYMPSKETFNERFIYPIIYKDESNFGISERLTSFESATDARIYQNLYALFYHKDVVPVFEFNGNDLIVTVNSNIRAIDRGVISAPNVTGTYTVRRNEYLIYNVDSKQILTRSSSSDLIKTDIILLFLTANSAIIGQWAPYYYMQKNREELIEAIDGLKPKSLPEYYFENDYLANKVSAINNIAIGLGRQSFQTFFITDCHWDDNAKVSPLLIDYLIDKTGIKNVIFGGDTINKSTVSKADGYAMVCEFLKDFSILEDKSNIYYITGNHEQNDPASNAESLRLNQEVSYRLFNEPVQHKIVCMDGTNTFYVDDNCAKIRYICVDCIYSSLISIEARVACFKAMDTVPEGYAFMIFSHTGCAYSGSTVDDFQVTGLTNRFVQIMECAKALNDGVPVEITIGSTTYSYDFTNRARIFCGAITGHVHFDGYYIYDDRFPVVAVTCDTGAYRDKQPARIAGTITEQAFDVVQVDVSAKRLYLTRIGYGDDRTFSFGETGAGLIA